MAWYRRSLAFVFFLGTNGTLDEVGTPGECTTGTEKADDWSSLVQKKNKLFHERLYATSEVAGEGESRGADDGSGHIPHRPRVMNQGEVHDEGLEEELSVDEVTTMEVTSNTSLDKHEAPCPVKYPRCDTSRNCVVSGGILAASACRSRNGWCKAPHASTPPGNEYNWIDGYDNFGSHCLGDYQQVSHYDYAGFRYYLGSGGQSCDARCSELGLENAEAAARASVPNGTCDIIQAFFPSTPSSTFRTSSKFYQFGYRYHSDGSIYCATTKSESNQLTNTIGVKIGTLNYFSGRSLVCPCQAPTTTTTTATTTIATTALGDYVFAHNSHCAGGGIVGSNIRQMSIEACASQCRDHSNCTYFAYDPVSISGTNCILYDVIGGCHYKSYRIENIITTTTSTTTTADGYTFVHNGHCAGGWIFGSSTRQPSIEACASQCRGNSKCTYFAYDSVSTSGMNCALYEGAGGCHYNSYRMIDEEGATTATTMAAGTVTGTRAYTQTTLADGVNQFNDRSYKLTEVPSYLLGAALFQGPCNHHRGDQITIQPNAGKTVTVYILVSKGNSESTRTKMQWILSPNNGWAQASNGMGTGSFPEAGFVVFSRTTADTIQLTLNTRVELSIVMQELLVGRRLS